MAEKISAPRIAWIDFAKGFGIILMVLGHTTEEGHLQNFIYVFHMPFFFVTAGFLLNLDKWGGAENYKKFSAKLFKRLLVPYYIAEILWYPIWFFVCHKFGYLNYLQRWADINPLFAFFAIFIGNANGTGLILGALWFLPALLVSEIIFVKIFNRLNKIGMEFFVLTTVIFSCVGLSMKNFFFLPLSIDIALVSQIFLLAGVLIKKYNIVERINLKVYVVLTLILIVAFCFNGVIGMNSRHYGNELLFYFGAIAGTLIVMKISSVMTPGKIFSLISSCGRQSMMILVLHLIVANIFYEIIDQSTNFPREEFFTEPIIIFGATTVGVLIPLWMAEHFGKFPPLKYFCTAK